MYKKTITLDLSPQGVRRVADEVREFAIWVKQKTDELLARLADIGWKEAEVNFAAVMPYYNSGEVVDIGGAVTEANITVDRIENGYVIRASGHDVCFIEFGAGVTYGEGYPGDRPEEVVGIGEYGKGHGADPKGWWYLADPVNKRYQHTKGNPPAAGMFAAEQTVRQQVYNIAKEVFA